MLRQVRWACGVALLGIAAALGCQESTGRLSPDQETRFAAEGLIRRADDIEFRYTAGGGRRGGRWEERVASIVVTGQSVYIHKNEKLGLELTPRSRRAVEVRRDGARIRITTGSGRSAESWSFAPPDDAEGWARDIRSVVNSRK